jgi:hypothetical protein
LAGHVHLADEYAPWKFPKGTENLVLQALQNEKLSICTKVASREGNYCLGGNEDETLIFFFVFLWRYGPNSGLGLPP